MDFLVQHLLRSSARHRPRKEALVHGERRLSYEEVERSSNRLAVGLRRIGFERGERVGIFLDKGIEEVISIFAALKAGGVFVPINEHLLRDQVRHIISDCRVRVLITSFKRLAMIQDDLPALDSLATVILTDDLRPGDKAASVPNCYSFAKLERSLPESMEERGISNDLAAILYTSGSTGKPKGVMLSHANLVAGSCIVSSYLEIGKSDRLVSVLPFSFDYGLNQLLTAFQNGGTLILLTFRFPSDITKVFLEEEITVFAGVPPLWCLLARPQSPLHSYDFPKLRCITNSGGAIHQEVIQSLRRALPNTDIVLMYGLTEAFRSTYLPPDQLQQRPTSMGKAIPDTQIFVVGETGELCQPGEVGELVHRGPTVCMGYWGNPKATRKVLRPHPFAPKEALNEELVCFSGDLVKMDSEDYLYFVGRRDEMIKCSGYRVSPNEVEEVLFSTGEIAAAAAIGVPDIVLGQRIKAFVVPVYPDQFDADRLLSFCSEKMPNYMVPRELQLLQELPKTSSGKVDYQALKRLDENGRTQTNRPPSVLTKHGNDSSFQTAHEIAMRNGWLSNGQLNIGGVPAARIGETHKSPLFIYDRRILERQLSKLRGSFKGNIDVYFSVKANPNRAIIEFFVGKGCGLEVASSGELQKAMRAGCPPERIVIAGPGKLESELEAAVEVGVKEIHVESFLEIERLGRIGREKRRRIPVSVRVNPSVDAQGGAIRMGGKPVPFGIDEEELGKAVMRISELDGLDFRGIHLFVGTQILDAQVLINQYETAIRIAKNAVKFSGLPLRTLDFGGGLGIPYFPNEKELDIETFAERVGSVVAATRALPNFRDTEFIVEPGRYLVAEAGVYLVRVNDIKVSRGHKFLVVDGGMNHHLAASGNLGQVIKKNFPIASVNAMDATPTEAVDVVGPLCTPLDTLARNVALPEPSVGDWLAVLQSGAYARTASPLGFLSRVPPAEVIVADGQVSLARAAGEFDDLDAPASEESVASEQPLLTTYVKDGD